MWKSISEAEMLFDNVVVLIRELVKRKLALDDTTPLDKYIEVETDNGICEVGLEFTDTNILNMNYGRVGEYIDNNLSISNIDIILNDTELKPKMNIKISLDELKKYNDIVVLPLNTNNLLLTGTLTEKNNIGFVFQDSNVIIQDTFKNIKYLDKLIVLDKNIVKPLNYCVLRNGTIKKIYINDAYINTCNYDISSCVIKNLYTTIDGLCNFDYCIVDSVKLLHIMDLDTLISGPSISSDISVINKRLDYLHRLNNNQKGTDLTLSHFNLSGYVDELKTKVDKRLVSNDIFYVYLADETDDAGFIEYFDLVIDDYIDIICDKFLVHKSKIKNIDVKNRIVSFTYDNGLNVVVILTKNSIDDIYSSILDGEMRKYKC